MIMEQEQLKNALLKAKTQADPYAEMITKQQYRTIGLLGSINKQKELETEARRVQLLSYIEVMKNNRGSNWTHVPTISKSKAKRFQTKDSESDSDSEDEEVRARPNVKMLNVMDLKKRKDRILSDEVTKAKLMNSIGIAKDMENIAKANLNIKTRSMIDYSSKTNVNANLIRKYVQNIKRSTKSQLSPIQRFRGMARVIAAFFILRKHSTLLNEKQTLLFIKHDILLHSAICKSWLLNCIKQVISSVIEETQEELLNELGDDSELKPIRVFVRIRGVISGLCENTNRVRMAESLLDFLRRCVERGNALPYEWMFPIERRYLRNVSQSKYTLL
eukprot:TRINITY_DN5631_c0_g1_i1.p1 TRINITY_DN5631_c0_g1~~TRINITY_DN5631_c0_g1_i1.p1  ORF type:complete len:332 (+),score=66.50 TRINITY_DN5631_c0_g1_i1:525-1520(+)